MAERQHRVKTILLSFMFHVKHSQFMTAFIANTAPICGRCVSRETILNQITNEPGFSEAVFLRFFYIRYALEPCANSLFVL